MHIHYPPNKQCMWHIDWSCKYMYMRKKRVTLPLTRAKMAESASKRYSQFDGEQPRSTDPLPVDATTPVSVSAVTDASASSNPADV